MYNTDFSSATYHQPPRYPETQNPNTVPDESVYHGALSYASAPPFSPRSYTPSADYTSPYNINSTGYGSFSNPVDPQPTAPSFSQPQSPYSFPRFEAHENYQTSFHSQSPPQFPSYPPASDQTAPSYLPNPEPNIAPSYSSVQSSSLYGGFPKPYEPEYENLDSRDRSEMYGERAHTYSGYGSDLAHGNSDGIYAYRGASEPYGARGTAPKSSTWSGFDDFGRPIGYSSPSSKEGSANSGLKVVRAVPKTESQQDAKSGVQKFRVKLLAEGIGQSTMDVLCQIGLDGIRMLEPSTGRTLRIYLLDSITKCEAIESSTFAFWSKSAVDIEPRRIRLQSNSYTTRTILDMVTAAIAQFKEIGVSSRSYDSAKSVEQPQEKKKGFDFMNLVKPINEEKDHWVPDEAVTKCTACRADFSAFNRRHHCRNCGDIFCDKCTHGRTALTADDNAPVVRVCDRCLADVSRRLSNAKEIASKPNAHQSHEELAKKLQEELERSCKVATGSASATTNKRMKEVACPTCTVHLQVQVPSSGSETIECGVCQQPFLVTA